jgi:hypothetical protein
VVERFPQIGRLSWNTGHGRASSVAVMPDWVLSNLSAVEQSPGLPNWPEGITTALGRRLDPDPDLA